MVDTQHEYMKLVPQNIIVTFTDIHIWYNIGVFPIRGE